MAEPSREWVHARIRLELGLAARNLPLLRDVLAQPLSLAAATPLRYPAARTWPIHAPARLAGGGSASASSMDESDQLTRTEHQPGPEWLLRFQVPANLVPEKQSARGSGS